MPFLLKLSLKKFMWNNCLSLCIPLFLIMFAVFKKQSMLSNRHLGFDFSGLLLFFLKLVLLAVLLISRCLFVIFFLALFFLLYVADVIVTGISFSLLKALIVTLQWEFVMKDLGPLHYFLGIEVNCSSSDLHLTQYKYVQQLFQWRGFLDNQPVSSPLFLTSRLSSYERRPLEDPYIYCQIIGALQYLTFTKPDISYAINSTF